MPNIEWNTNAPVRTKVMHTHTHTLALLGHNLLIIHILDTVFFCFDIKRSLLIPYSGKMEKRIASAFIRIFRPALHVRASCSISRSSIRCAATLLHCFLFATITLNVWVRSALQSDGRSLRFSFISSKYTLKSGASKTQPTRPFSVGWQRKRVCTVTGAQSVLTDGNTHVTILMSLLGPIGQSLLHLHFKVELLNFDPHVYRHVDCAASIRRPNHQDEKRSSEAHNCLQASQHFQLFSLKFRLIAIDCARLSYNSIVN